MRVRRFTRRRVAGLLAACLGLAAAIAAVGPVSAAQPNLNGIPAVNGLRSAARIAAPSIVEVQLEIDGALRTASGVSPSRQLGFAGTGFFVSGDGYIVTAAHVGAPTHEDIHHELVDAQVDADHHCEPTTTDACLQVEERYGPALYAASTAVDVATSVRVVTQEMTAEDPGLDAEVVASSPSTNRDIAVLHVHIADAPVLSLAGAAPTLGSPLVVEGYPESAGSTLVPVVTAGSVEEVRAGDPGFAPDATVIGTDAHIEHGDSGGPGLDLAGAVVGIVSYGPSESNNYLVSAGDVRALLAGTAARNVTGRIDQLWRDGLDAEARGDLTRARALLRECADLNPVQVGCRDEADHLAGRPTAPPLARPVMGSATAAEAPATSAELLLSGLAAGVVIGVAGTLGATAVLRRRDSRVPAPPPGWWWGPPGWVPGPPPWSAGSPGPGAGWSPPPSREPAPPPGWGGVGSPPPQDAPTSHT